MKKKKSLILSLILMALILLPIGTKAIYNGIGGKFSFSSGTGSKECGSASNCQYNNRNVFYLQIQLFYIDSTAKTNQWTSIGDVYYITGKNSKSYLTGTLGVSSSKVIVVEALDNISTTDSKRYKKASDALRAYFGDDDNSDVTKVANKHLRSFLKKATNPGKGKKYYDMMTLPTETANKTTPATKGYRVIIEPAVAYVNASWNNGAGGIMSPKDAALNIKNGTIKSWSVCSFPIVSAVGVTGGNCSGHTKQDAQSQFLETEFEDVGIKVWSSMKKGNSCATIGTDDLANHNIGCGFNIIDVGKFVAPTCYKYESDTSGFTCSTNNEVNEHTFTEKYTSTKCEEEDDSATEDGKKLDENENCYLYCKESAHASFPGGITEPFVLNKVISRDSYFAWPARYNSTIGMKMSMSSTYACKVVAKPGRTCSQENVTSLVNSANGKMKDLEMGAKLTAGTNKKIDEELVISYSNTSFADASKVKLGDTFTTTKKAYFEIPSTRNRYYNYTTNTVSDAPGSGQVFDRKQGVVSLSGNEKENENYYLTISDVTLGTGNEFGKTITNYSCPYKVSNACRCLPTDINADADLYKYLELGKSCEELKQLYCNQCECPPGSEGDDNDLDLSSEWTTRGSTKEACEQVKNDICYAKTCTTKEGKQIPESEFSACVSNKMNNEKLNKNDATILCKQEKCPGTDSCTDEKGVKHDLTECQKKGNSYLLCYYRYCPGSTCRHGKCPACTVGCKWKKQEKQVNNTYIMYVRSCRNQNGAENCGVLKLHCPNKTCQKDNKLLTCISNNLKLGNTSIEAALNANTITANDVMGAAKVCTEESTNTKVIYRTIDLDNPFPSSDNTLNVTKYSNTGTSGRYPNYNWDSVDLVKTKILEARGVKGQQLYNKTPLYTIVLTPETMKKIKSKYNGYNDGKDYSDFNLKCKSSTEPYNCISSFLHNSEYVKIDTSKSVEKCYNLTSTGNFDACYNENN